jgi:hypothetical protein
MSEQRAVTVLRWAWFALTIVTLLVVGRMARYAPEGDGYFWDRWKHRECEAVEGRLDCSAVEDRPVQTAEAHDGAGPTARHRGRPVRS